METEKNILIGGEAGQGLVTVGQLLSKALVRSGYEVHVTQSYHSRIRGGHNTFAVRAGLAKMRAPRDAVDLLVALNDETVELHQQQMSEQGLLVIDAASGKQIDKSLRIPYAEFAEEQMFNTVALGVLGALLGLTTEVLEKGIEDLIGVKHPEAMAPNKEILAKSFAWAENNRPQNFTRLAPIRSQKNRIMVNGNEAIALGAMAAGLKFCSFYPMTPSTSIALTLIAHADAMEMVVEQVEDEIAAINMAIGASFSGAPSIVTTSGGGFALMTEGVSLAGMTETPVLVVIAQRPGPATGLPTRTEQGDLDFVLHGGHGEFAKAIYAPATVDSCYLLTARALQTAEKFQTPVFLLTDQYLADSYRAVEPFEMQTVQSVARGCEADKERAAVPYERYAAGENGISPRLLPGMSEQLVVADSDEHTGDGHITEDLKVRVVMVDKRLAKLAAMRQEVMEPSFDGEENADLLLLAWGSTAGAVWEAADRLREQGTKVSTLIFEQLWPLQPGQLMAKLTGAKQVVCVEGNATGQFSGLVRRETGFGVHDRVLRYDGLPFTADYICDQITTLREVS